MASFSIQGNAQGLELKKLQILDKIKCGEMMPKAAIKEYNNTARALGLQKADDELEASFIFWRKDYNKRRRAERAAQDRVAAWCAEVREASTGEFRSVPPPRSQRLSPQTRDVPAFPEGGETKMPCCVAVEITQDAIDWNIPFACLA